MGAARHRGLLWLVLPGILQGTVDATVVISNVSELEFRVREARDRDPVGTFNPTKGYTSGALKGSRLAGCHQLVSG
jgi:hypothetical protein